jgi:hypothetical protein
MKKLFLILLLLLPLTPSRASDHSNAERAVIAFTAVGATTVARSLSFAVKDPVKKVAVNAILTGAAAYGLMRASERLSGSGAAGRPETMYHAAKDGAAVTAVVCLPLGVFKDLWRAPKAGVKTRKKL